MLRRQMMLRSLLIRFTKGAMIFIFNILLLKTWIQIFFISVIPEKRLILVTMKFHENHFCIFRGFFWQIREILPPQNLFCSIYLISLSAKLLYVFFSLVSVLKRIILLFNTLNCEQYKSELYWFSYYISSNFEKLRFVPVTITLDISIQIWQLPK